MAKQLLWDVDEAAARFRVQPNTVRDWIRRGLPVVERGSRGAGKKSLIDPIEALPWFLDYIGSDAEKVRLAKEQADRVALENAERRGDLAPISVLAKEFADASSVAIALLSAIPTKEAPMLAPMTDPNAIHARLTAAINDALQRVAEFGRSLRSQEGPSARGRRTRGVRAPARANGKRVGRGESAAQ